MSKINCDFKYVSKKLIYNDITYFLFLILKKKENIRFQYLN